MPSSASGSAETLPGSALGTPAYMSPEQAARRPRPPRAALRRLQPRRHALLPADRQGPVRRRRRRGPPQGPEGRLPAAPPARPVDRPGAGGGLPEGDGDAARGPLRRRCRALAEDVERWAADEPVSAWREPLARRARRWAKRNRTAVTGAAVALVAGVVGLSAVLAVQTQAKADIARSLASETGPTPRWPPPTPS